MFSANENLQLRQHKRRVVQYVEETIPEEVLALGVNVMVMQVSCKAPGCVPLETAIVIVFPHSDEELLTDLPESRGGSYKCKVLKPMASVTKEDVLEALPPTFLGGKRSVEKLCLQARDVMLGQITQLFSEDDVEGRRLMAQYLRQSLEDYINRECVPPAWGEAFPPLSPTEGAVSVAGSVTRKEGGEIASSPGKNIVMKRVIDTGKDEEKRTSSTMQQKDERLVRQDLNESATRRRMQQSAEAALQTLSGSSIQDPLSRLAQREHAPGMRQPGCPCCDPDNPHNLVDQLLQF